MLELARQVSAVPAGLEQLEQAEPVLAGRQAVGIKCEFIWK